MSNIGEILKVAKELLAMPSFEEAPGFRAAFSEFLGHCQKVSDDYMADQFPTLEAPKFSAMEGGRFIRVVRDSRGSRSAHLFVDKTNGDILKTAGWSAPAKHARGNIFDKATWKNVGPYGAAYLR